MDIEEYLYYLMNPSQPGEPVPIANTPTTTPHQPTIVIIDGTGDTTGTGIYPPRKKPAPRPAPTPPPAKKERATDIADYLFPNRPW